jgi:hypothetical protein
METFLVDNYRIWHRITNFFFVITGFKASPVVMQQ